MKVFLMHPEQDFDLAQPAPAGEEALVQDLELNTLFDAMAVGDEFLFKVARKAVLANPVDLDTIRYRQSVLQDCLRNADVVRRIYQIPVQALERKRKHWRGVFSKYPAGILSGARDVLQMYVDLLGELREIADAHAGDFESAGFKRFFSMIEEELDDEYLAVVRAHLKRLKFGGGVLVSAVPGKGNEGADYVLRRPNEPSRNLLERVFTRTGPVYGFRIHPRDYNGSRALSELQDRGINLVANALAQSADHIESFVNVLRVELAFYVGCLNLSERLSSLGELVCFPVPAPAAERRHTCKGLYDVCLALTMGRTVVGNDTAADDKDLVIITGANQGGKSTFLRSVGVSQLMMQCGMFVPAESFCANVSDGLFSHYRREEDAAMESGKLDEELGRMSDIIDALKPNSMLLFNESFSSSNEREGSEIAGQIVSALLENGVKMFFVSHLYEFARRFQTKGTKDTLFLRAERGAGGARTFQLIEGPPLQTSYGADLYEKVFAAAPRSPTDEQSPGTPVGVRSQRSD
ncbi:MAG: hypothetical protein WB783_00575 [Arenicellales bacterium]